MTQRYEISRSHTDSSIHVISRDARFHKDVPPSILHLGPWVGGGRGNIADLKAEYRALLEMQGFVLVHCGLIKFSKMIANVEID